VPPGQPPSNHMVHIVAAQALLERTRAHDPAGTASTSTRNCLWCRSLGGRSARATGRSLTAESSGWCRMLRRRTTTPCRYSARSAVSRKNTLRTEVDAQRRAGRVVRGLRDDELELDPVSVALRTDQVIEVSSGQPPEPARRGGHRTTGPTGGHRRCAHPGRPLRPRLMPAASAAHTTTLAVWDSPASGAARCYFVNSRSRIWTTGRQSAVIVGVNGIRRARWGTAPVRQALPPAAPRHPGLRHDDRPPSRRAVRV
jgi:hypothetical protein